MNLQEKKQYILDNAHLVPQEDKDAFDFNLACVLTKNSVGMESGKMASLEEVVSIVKGHNTKVDETLKRGVYNYYKAYMMVKDYLANNNELTEEFLKDLHEQIVDRLMDCGGLYRNVNIKIKGSMHTPCDYIKVYDRMKKYFYDINNNDKEDFEAIAYAHLQLAKIHPFLDANGRLARLVLNFFLMKYGYPAISIPTKRRLEYFDLLEEFKVNKNQVPFENFLKELVDREYDRMIDVIDHFKK